MSKTLYNLYPKPSDNKVFSHQSYRHPESESFWIRSRMSPWNDGCFPSLRCHSPSVRLSTQSITRLPAPSHPLKPWLNRALCLLGSPAPPGSPTPLSLAVLLLASCDLQRPSSAHSQRGPCFPCHRHIETAHREWPHPPSPTAVLPVSAIPLPPPVAVVGLFEPL